VTSGDEVLRLAVEGGHAALAAVRADLEAWAWARGVEGEALADLAVVLSELVANAITASPPGRAPEVVATMDGDAVALEVRNASRPGEALGTRWDLEDPLRAGGRGLVIVSAFCDEMEVALDPDGDHLVVRCRLRVR